MTPIELTAAEYWHASETDMAGVCRACGAWTYSVEPDARRYPCESCGAREVYGLPELLQRGEVEITEGWDEDRPLASCPPEIKPGLPHTTLPPASWLDVTIRTVRGKETYTARFIGRGLAVFKAGGGNYPWRWYVVQVRTGRTVLHARRRRDALAAARALAERWDWDAGDALEDIVDRQYWSALNEFSYHVRELEQVREDLLP